MNSPKYVMRAGVCALSLVLVACGGGGGTNSTPAPPTGGGGNPAPTPGPAPAPAPPPSNANGDLLGNLQSEDFTNIAAGATLSSDGTNRTVTNGSITASIIYDASDQSYTLQTPTGTLTFTPADVDNAQSNDGSIVYVITNGNTTNSLTLTRAGTSGPITYQYVGSAFWQQVTNNTTSGSGSIDSLVYGVETPDGDVPRTGSADFDIDLIGAMTVGENISPLAGNGTASVDFGSGDIVILGQLTLAPFQGPDSTFTGVAELSSSTGVFSGTFTFQDFGLFQGDIAGRLFGPAADEIGAVWSVNNNSDRVATGTIMGRRGTTPANTQFNAVDPLLDNSQTFTTSAKVVAFGAQNRPGQNGFLDFNNISGSESPMRLRFDAATNQLLIASDYAETLYDFNSARFPNNLGTTRAEYRSERLTYVNMTGWKLFLEPLTPDNRHAYWTYGFATDDSNVPRTGSAAYALDFIGSGVDPDFNADFRIGGTGLLRTDFATGAIDLTGALGISENISLSGVPTFGTTAQLIGSGMLSASVNSFSGTLTLDGIGNYAGVFDGLFFGPDAEEVGGTFAASDDNGEIAGAFIGEKDDDASAGGVPLADLTGTTELVGVRQEDVSFDRVSITYDADAGTYTIPFRDFPDDRTVNLSAADIDAARSDAARTYYVRDEVGGFDGYIFNADPNNPEFVLTYSTFAAIRPVLEDFPSGTIRGENVYYSFGLATPSAAIPRVGSATYTGGAVGSARFDAATYIDVAGDATLTANFTDSTFQSIINLIAQDGSLRDFGQFNLDGQIDINGVLFGGLNGQLYGPNAEEVGGVFDIIDDSGPSRIIFQGVVYGTR